MGLQSHVINFLLVLWCQHLGNVCCRGNLISQEDVMSLIRPFCANTEVPVEPRLDALRFLEEVCSPTVDLFWCRCLTDHSGHVQHP